jgi:hypothetical protein
MDSLITFLTTPPFPLSMYAHTKACDMLVSRLASFFGSQDKGGRLLWNYGLTPNCITLQPRQPHSSHSLLGKPQIPITLLSYSGPVIGPVILHPASCSYTLEESYFLGHNKLWYGMSQLTRWKWRCVHRHREQQELLPYSYETLQIFKQK